MGGSEMLSWVSKIGEKRMLSEKVKKLSRSFEEQDDDINQNRSILHGLKVVHGGLDKVIEGGGAIVLTLKDQSILGDDGYINQEIDMLENVEIREQKRRDEAYKAAKKRNQVYDDDKFNNEYVDPVGDDEGFTLDASGGGFSGGDAKKKLDELRKRISGRRFENLNSLGAISTSDYYTHEEMLQFQKPKKKKKSSLRRKKEEKLDIIDALEAEAISTGDLGSRNEGKKRQAMKMEQEKSEADMRSSNAYRAAYAKADEASKALRPRLDQTLTMKIEDDDNPVFDDDDDDLRKSLAKARKLGFQEES